MHWMRGRCRRRHGRRRRGRRRPVLVRERGKQKRGKEEGKDDRRKIRTLGALAARGTEAGERALKPPICSYLIFCWMFASILLDVC